MDAEIPVVDISGLTRTDSVLRSAVAREIGTACRSIGFFAIQGHGIPASQIDDAFAAARAVFALPPEAKSELAIGLHGHNRGYVGMGVEALDEHTAPDLKEAYNLIWTDGGATRPPNVWPPIAGWQERTQAYFDAVLAVGQRLHRAFALDLGIDEHFFDDKLDKPQATLRFLHYPVHAGADALRGKAGAGEHTDYGNVTLLATDGVAGLQVRRRDGRWIDVPAMPGAFICNVGDCLMRWANDVYQSTPHRVLAPQQERYSIAFFLDPNPDAVVEAIPTCLAPGESPKYPRTTAGEYLQARFAATYGGRQLSHG
jgi:isopenicillin N synthase-like dioxygenase